MQQSKFALSIALSAVVAAMVLSPVAANANCANIKPKRPGEVYLLRGLANIFSLGLDQTGATFSKMGIRNCVFNHKHWRSLADDIVERAAKGQVSFPVVIIGHSLGAGVAPKMATLIGKFNNEVSYVVMLDPVEPTVIGKNVQRIVNYYLPKKRKSNILRAGRGFSGVLENVNVKKLGGFDHFNIDENKDLKKIMFTYTLELSNAFAEAAKENDLSRK